MRKQIHVNQHVIRANRKTGASDPPITIKTYKGNNYASAVEILGPSKLVYQPDCPSPAGLTCGSRRRLRSWWMERMLDERAD